MELLMLLVTLLNQLMKSQNPDESYMGTLNLQFREFIQDDEQDEDMISQYTSIYNAIEKWESDHRETEIFQQLAVSELFNQLNK